MRKLIVSNFISLDGYVEGPDRNVMALPIDGFFDEYNLERLRTSATLLLGATTYMGLKGYWPAVADNPELSPAVALNPEMDELHRETGQRNNQIQKMVVSDNLTEHDTAPWTDTTIIVRRADAQDAVSELKGRPGKDILMLGSRTLWNDLLVAGLVDELHLMIGAAIIGGGTRAFDSEPGSPLRLINTRRREGSENVLLQYAVARRDE
jgi:dihydrofolate reductase